MLSHPCHSGTRVCFCSLPLSKRDRNKLVYLTCQIGTSLINTRRPESTLMLYHKNQHFDLDLEGPKTKGQFSNYVWDTQPYQVLHWDLTWSRHRQREAGLHRMSQENISHEEWWFWRISTIYFWYQYKPAKPVLVCSWRTRLLNFRGTHRVRSVNAKRFSEKRCTVSCSPVVLILNQELDANEDREGYELPRSTHWHRDPRIFLWKGRDSGVNDTGWTACACPEAELIIEVSLHLTFWGSWILFPVLVVYTLLRFGFCFVVVAALCVCIWFCLGFCLLKSGKSCG